MKRIQAACICQTLLFAAKEDVDPNWAARQVAQEVESYKKHLTSTHTKHRILEEAAQPDGSVTIKIIKQYNTSPVGDYLD